tara:strand:- start:273 stop:1019 length:747 start_codon:yes stop_codon:yes gene_type:complete
MKIIQITDLHLRSDKNYNAFEINTFQSAEMIISHISKQHRDIGALVISGDISDDETSESYSNLMEITDQINTEIYLMPGNHDSIEEIEKCASNNRVNSELYFMRDNWVFFMFNTKKNNSPNGLLKQHEIDIFINMLRENSDKFFMIFLHHHPVKIGSPTMDKMIIENANILLELIEQYKSIRGVSWGHIHNVFETQLNNAKLFSTPSTCYQSKPKSKSFVIDEKEKPGYRIIHFSSSGELKTEVRRMC